MAMTIEQQRALAMASAKAAAAQAHPTAPGATAAPPPGLVPGSREYADWAAAQARAGNKLPAVGPQPAPVQQHSAADQIDAGFTSAVNALPIVGPKALEGIQNVRAAVQGQPLAAVQSQDVGNEAANPTASTVGSVVGTVAPFAVGGEIPMVAKVLGMDSSVPLLARSLASMGTSAAITGADSFVRNGGDIGQSARDAALGGGFGLIAPGAGDLIGKAAGWAGNKIAQGVDALTNVDRAAGRVTNGAIAQDVKSGKMMSPADEANAAINAQPVINADRFGTNTRNLARTAANADSTAQQALNDTVQQRFLTQAPRAVDFVKRVTGGNVNDLALQDSVRAAARQSNRAAYGRAEAHPNAQAILTPDIVQLFQSGTFRKAVQDATATAAEDAAINGGQAVRNPFVFDAQGKVSLRVNPDGSKAIPNLKFWDIVQRNLRKASEKAARVPDGLSDSTSINQIRGKLLDVLDTAVPDFKTARAGAAAAFGAEDAIDAGRKFVSQRMGIPEATRAYAKFTPAERKAFATGFASELIDKIGAASDTVNVINSVFGSPAARKQVELALGKNAATELEHFVRVENIMQMTKQAVQGNSSTARQLIASGLIGGGLGGAIGGWDPRNVASGAFLLTAGRAGMRALGKSVDQKVMQRVAELLSSNDPAALTKATQSAVWSPAFREAINAIEHGLSALTRGAATDAVRSGPVQIMVNGGSAPTAAPGP